MKDIPIKPTLNELARMYPRFAFKVDQTFWNHTKPLGVIRRCEVDYSLLTLPKIGSGSGCSVFQGKTLRECVEKLKAELDATK